MQQTEPFTREKPAFPLRVVYRHTPATNHLRFTVRAAIAGSLAWFSGCGIREDEQVGRLNTDRFDMHTTRQLKAAAWVYLLAVSQSFGCE